MFTRAFLVAAAERGIKTFSQALLAALTLSSPSIDVLHINWVGDLSLAAGATLLSVLTSLSGLVPPTSPTPAAAVAVAPAVPVEITDALRQLPPVPSTAPATAPPASASEPTPIADAALAAAQTAPLATPVAVQPGAVF